MATTQQSTAATKMMATMEAKSDSEDVTKMENNDDDDHDSKWQKQVFVMHQFPQILRFPFPPTPPTLPCDRSADREPDFFQNHQRHNKLRKDDDNATINELVLFCKSINRNHHHIF